MMKPDPLTMTALRTAWVRLIRKKLIELDAYQTRNGKTLTIFCTLNTRALKYLDEIEWCAIRRLMETMITTNVLVRAPYTAPVLDIDAWQQVLMRTAVYDPNRSAKYPYHRVTNLTPHAYQDQNIEWLIHNEHRPVRIRYKPYYTHALVVPGENRHLYCNIDSRFINLYPSVETERTVEIPGGVLADEMGLGKTLSALMACIGHRRKEWIVRRGHFHSRATLIVVPNHLTGQWETETQLILKKHLDIKIVHLLTKTNFNSKTLRDLLEADFVVTSFQYLMSTTVGDPFEKNKRESPQNMEDQLAKYREDLYRRVRKNPRLLDEKGVSLYAIDWWRIIIDEIQEVSKIKFTIPESFVRGSIVRGMSLRDLIMLLEGKNRVVLSGTPFAGSAFLMQDAGFLLAFLTRRWDAVGALFDPVSLQQLARAWRRNMKDAVKTEYKPVPLEERVIRIPFSMEERIMYSSYVADSSTDPGNKHIRMLCCNPDLASDTSKISANTSGKIRKKMMRQFKKDLGDIKLRLRTAKSMQVNVADRLERLGDRVERIPDSEPESDIDNSDYDSTASDTDSDSSSSSSDSDGDLVVANQGALQDEGNSEDVINRSESARRRNGANNEDNDPDADEERRLRMEMTSEQLRNSLQSTQARIRTLREQRDGKSRSLNFMSTVTKQLKKGKRGECAICLDRISKSATGLTMCGHIFCYQCIGKAREQQGKCPTCRTVLTKQDVHHVVDVETDRRFVQQYGSKINYLIKLLLKTRKRVIIFSQWTELLERLGAVLRTKGIGNVFCKGNTHQKNRALIKFRTDKKCTVLMMSTDTSVAGANLTEAEYIIFLDPVWGTLEFRRATEAQAISRTLRMGQKAKRVKVFRLVIKDTIEDDIVSGKFDNMGVDASANQVTTSSPLQPGDRSL
jgi:SNF2 family DNA or RNA helicase